MAKANLRGSQDLINTAQAVAGKPAIDAEALHQQAVTLGASFGLLTNILSQNIGKLNAQGKDAVGGSSGTNAILDKLYARDADFSNEDGKKLVASMTSVTQALDNVEGDLTVSVESLVDNFSELAANTNFSDTRRNEYLRDLIGVMQRNNVGAEDIVQLSEIAQKRTMDESDTGFVSAAARNASKEARDNDKKVVGSLSDLNTRFKSMQITQEELYDLQNKNNLRQALEEAATSISLGNNASMNEATSTTLEVFGIGGPVGDMMSEFIGDKVANATSYMGEQISGKLLDMEITQKAIDKMSSIKAKIQAKRDKVLDRLLFRKRTKEDESIVEGERVVGEEHTEAQTATIVDALQTSTDDANINSEARAKAGEKERRQQTKKENKSLAKAIGKESSSGISIMGMGMMATIATMGGTLLAGLTAVLPALAVAGVAAAAVGVGTLISSGLDKATQFFTNGDNDTFGGAIYDFFNDTSDEDAQRARELEVILAKNAIIKAKQAAGELPTSRVGADMTKETAATERAKRDGGKAPVVTVNPTPIVVQPAPVNVVTKSNTPDDTGLLVLQGSVG